jgi:paraquat-inducible protein B
MNVPPEREDRQGPAEPEGNLAEVKRGWWPGWIWGIPVAALAAVSWLGMRALLSGNESITIRFADAHGLQPNNTVVYRGATIGRVTAVALDEDGDGVTVTAAIDGRATRLLRLGTRFWLQGANPSFTDLSSLGALVSGPSIVMDPGPGARTTSFAGLERKPVSPSADAQVVLYAVSFKDGVGTLQSGDPVELYGFTIGEVRSIGFSYDATTGNMSMPGTLALYPALFHIRGVPDPASPAMLNAALADLIQKGMRARLAQEPPLVGTYHVSLEIIAGAPPAVPTRMEGMPLIPSAPGVGLGSILTQLNKVPIEQITHNILDATHHIDSVVSSPALKDAISQLDASLRQIHAVTTQAGPQITVLVTRLRTAADDLDTTAKSAQKLVGGTATQNGLTSSVEEITQAARALRSLAEYLDRHPEALIKGRGEGT